MTDETPSDQVLRAARAMVGAEAAWQALASLSASQKAAAIADLMAAWLADQPAAKRKALMEALVRGAWELTEINDSLRETR